MLQRFEEVLALHTFMAGYGTEDCVKRSNPQAPMRGHSDAMAGRFASLQYDVAALLVNNPVGPFSTEQVNEILPAQVAWDLHPLVSTSSRTR
jgi:hypothetical protein